MGATVNQTHSRLHPNHIINLDQVPTPASAVPIFLVKKELDNPFLNRLNRLMRGFLRDGTHWALMVGVTYYHLGVENGKGSKGPLYLDTSNLTGSLVSWKFGGKKHTMHCVGKTCMSDEEIRQAGMYSCHNGVHRAAAEPATPSRPHLAVSQFQGNPRNLKKLDMALTCGPLLGIGNEISHSNPQSVWFNWHPDILRPIRPKAQANLTT
ncbi:hypothetical protein BJV74DRAFT_796856 [Russula compacta]|nr:hypothetical protein BJV74DRAFT_796856 [Russula compacta]